MTKQYKAKTIPTDADVAAFLAKLDDEQRHDSEKLIEIMQKISGKLPVMWGPSIIGFGTYHFTYESGREGDVFNIGFSPRKGKLSLYITDNPEKFLAVRERLGKHSVGKACIYIKRLSDIDINALEDLIHACYHDTSRKF